MSIPGNVIARHCNGTRYIGAAVVIPPRHYNCEPMPIQASHRPRSQDPDAIVVVGGTAVMPERLFCGSRVSSQGLPFTEGRLLGGQMTINAPLTDVANFSSAPLGASEGSQTHEVLEVRTAALCNNKGDNANIALGIKQTRFLC